jgi:hypothetical protein
MAHQSSRIVALSLALASLALSPLAAAQRHPRRHPRHPQAAPVALDAPALARTRGTLDDDSPTDDAGHHVQARTVTLRRGDAVRFGVSSSDFDTVARASGPGGQQWEDDDGAGRGTDSLLQFTAPRDGRYELTVTSYEAGESGAFRTELSVARGGAVNEDDAAPDADSADASDDTNDDAPADVRPTPAQPAAAGAGTTWGIFVGISRYDGENDDLPGSAGDARNLARSFERAGWTQRGNAVVLTDREATLDQVRQAFRSVAPRVRANDTLVFFFDGHGSSDTLDLRGEDLSRRELGRLLDRVPGRSLLVLDSCEAGGFASVVRGHEGRAGLFSSRANESSSTAPEVGAGGWLAYNFRRAIDGGVRRRPDGSIDLGEVVRYVERDYRARDLDQQLVATQATRGDFALGGPGAAAPATGNDIGNGDDNGDDSGDDNGDDPQYAHAGTGAPGTTLPAVMNLGAGFAGQMIQALTK